MLQSYAKPMDVTWLDNSLPIMPAAPVSAARLHVLQLDPIKERIGPRWGHLSELVHKLFEKALRRAQGPRDHFVLVAELSYVATFHGLTPEEARVACTAVAKEVCELLFGQDTENVSVRSLIGSVPGPVLDLREGDAAKMVAALEKTGREVIVTRRPAEPAAPEPDWLAEAHEEAARLHHPIGFYPVWELAKKKSQMLVLGMETRQPHPRGPVGVLRALGPCDAVLGMEISLLRAAAAYRARVESAGKICAIMVGVSSDTLCCVHSRALYLKAVRAARLSPACPLFIKIEQIPPGMPLGRLGEIAALLAGPAARLLLEFEQIRSLTSLNIKLGVSGIGVLLPERCTPEEASLLAPSLRLRAREQNACSFLHGLDSPALVAAAGEAGLKFGAGMGFDQGRPFSGLEELPRLPLSLSPQGKTEFPIAH